MGNGVGMSVVAADGEFSFVVESTRKLLSALTMPGMYRLYDFHSPKAPKLKSLERPKFFFGFQSYLGDESEEESEKEEDQPDPSLYAHYFNVTLGDEQIYIEDPLEPNEAGQL